MFCPRCGQQAAEEVRFCSRCGLPLDGAAELLEAGERRDTALAQAEANAGLTPRQRGTRKGLLILAGGLVFSVIVGILMAIKEDFFPFLILAGLIITVGVMRTLYGLLLEASAPAKKLPRSAADSTPTHPREATRAAELPPARAVPANVYAKPGAHTSDMVAPHSVTENTTKLLDD
jgi:hypothetical protein